MERRLRILVMAPEVLVGWLTPQPATRTTTLHGETYTFPVPPFTAVRCRRGLPEGARVVSARFDWVDNNLELVVEHESFEPVPAHQVPPTIPGSEMLMEHGDPRACCFGHPCPECRKD